MATDTREIHRKLLWMVGVALALRLVTMAYVYPLQLVPDRGGEHWPFGYETGKIAASIAEGHGFSNPLFAPTGPTAWMTPVYPYFMAGVFKVFGVYSTASALVMLTFNALTSALTCLPIFFFARRSFGAPLGERAGEWAGWIWALFPYAIYWPVDRIWDTWLATLLLAILFCMALRLAETNRARDWIAFGALSGFAALTDPVVLSVLPFLALWALWRLHRLRVRWFPSAIGCALATIIVISPWVVRNYRVFHKFIPLRDNFALALRVGNIGDTRHMLTLEAGPWLNENEWRLYQRVGEIVYMRYARDAALDYISAHPREYVDSCVRRAVYFWTHFWPLPPKLLAGFEPNPGDVFLITTLTILALLGLRDAFRKKSHGAGAYAIVLLLFPAVYYATSLEPWYRVPMDPMVIALAAYAITSRLGPRIAPEQSATIAGVRDDSSETEAYSRVSSTSHVA